MRGINHAEDFGWSNAPRFGGGGGGTTSTNTVQNSDPWIGQQGPLNQVYHQAQVLNDQGNYPQYFPGNTYSGLTQQQQGLQSGLIGYTAGGGATNDAAQQSLINGALNPGYTQGTSNTFNQANPTIGALGSGSQIGATQPAFNAGQGYLANTIQGSPQLWNATGAANTGNNYLGTTIAGGGVNQTQPAFNQSQGYLSNTLTGNTPAQGYYSNMISGANLDPFKAPGFQNVVAGTLANVLPAVNSSFVGGNRNGGLGTAAATSAATNAVGSLANQNYLQEQQLQAQAAQAQGQQQQAAAGLSSQNQLAQQGLQSSAASQAAQNLAQQQQLQQAAAAQAAANQGTALNTTLGAGSLASNNLLTQQGNQLKGAAVAPIVDQGITGNLGTALSTAGMTQQDQQNQLNAQIAAYNYNQMSPWNNLGLFENAVVGTGSPGGSSNTTGTQPFFTNPTANAASAASAAAALGMLAFTAFSDRNLKTDVDEVGETHSGFPLYTFRYKWEGPMARHIGVMAQDVEKTRPHAVIHTPVGRMVNYMEALAA